MTFSDSCQPLFPLSKAHQLQWEKLQMTIRNEKFPQALLLIGPSHLSVSSFAYRLLAHLLCHEAGDEFCRCKSCHLLAVNNHPDAHLIYSELPSSVIKIEKIRLLQEEVYQRPLCGSKRVILIDGAEKMNYAASNALLKILEEPPVETFFILVAEQYATMPATIVSRCSRMVFPDSIFDGSNYLLLGQCYPSSSPRAELYTQRMAIIDSISRVVLGQLSPSEVADQWITTYAFVDIIWILYLILSETIKNKILNNQPDSEEKMVLTQLSEALSTPILLNQLAKMHSIIKKNNQSIAFNSQLIMEDFLIGFLEFS